MSNQNRLSEASSWCEVTQLHATGMFMVKSTRANYSDYSGRQDRPRHKNHLVHFMQDQTLPENEIPSNGCSCEDFTFKKEEHHGWCKHRLAVALSNGCSTEFLRGLLDPGPPIAIELDIDGVKENREVKSGYFMVITPRGTIEVDFEPSFLRVYAASVPTLNGLKRIWQA